MDINLEILKNLVLYNPVNKKIRLGHQKDGGYVIIDGYDYDCFLNMRNIEFLAKNFYDLKWLSFYNKDP